MTPEMWHDLLEFQSEAHRQQHLDVDYIFHKLRTQNAFNFVATLNEACTGVMCVHMLIYNLEISHN